MSMHKNDIRTKAGFFYYKEVQLFIPVNECGSSGREESQEFSPRECPERPRMKASSRAGGQV